MSDLGQLLKKARMERKITLDDLSETTKIRKAYLEAIEEGNFKMLPGNFYVRAFIKSYAEAVGLDPGEVLRLYQNVIPAADAEANMDVMHKPRVSSRNTERFSKLASNIMMISFIVLILGIIYYFLNVNYTNNHKDESSAANQRITDKTQASLPPSISEGGGSNNLPESKPEPVPAPEPVVKPEVKFVHSDRGVDYYDVTNADKLHIEMKVTGDACWMEVDSITDKKKMLGQGTYTNGKTQTWELDTSAFIIVGKANAVEITVNGTSIEVGDTPNPKRIQLDLKKS